MKTEKINYEVLAKGLALLTEEIEKIEGLEYYIQDTLWNIICDDLIKKDKTFDKIKLLQEFNRIEF